MDVGIGVFKHQIDVRLKLVDLGHLWPAIVTQPCLVSPPGNLISTTKSLISIGDPVNFSPFLSVTVAVTFPAPPAATPVRHHRPRVHHHARRHRG